jgi:hypothetical protein
MNKIVLPDCIKTPPRIWATFQRQQWTGRRDDCSAPVGDPERIDVTSRVLRMEAENITCLSDDSYEGDALVEGRHDHDGPFAVYIREEVGDFFELYGVVNLHDLTEEHLGQLRELYGIDISTPEPKQLLWSTYLGPAGTDVSVVEVTDSIKGLLGVLKQPNVFATPVISRLYNESAIVFSREVLTADEASDLYDTTRSKMIGQADDLEGDLQ